MILKSRTQIDKMRAAGLVVWQAHQAARKLIAPGATTGEIDAAVEATILDADATPLFKGVPGVVPYPAATCVSLNEEIVHGIPSERELSEGDIVSIDIGVRLKGWCADAATTWPVGEISAERQDLLNVTEGMLRYAISQLGSSAHWRPIAAEMQRRAEAHGYSVVEVLVGHGIGQEMWEPPSIPNYDQGPEGDFEIKPGAVLAIEPMVTTGSKQVGMLPDHWTIVAVDGSLSAHFEHTVAITDDGPMILTAGPDGEGWATGS